MYLDANYNRHKMSIFSQHIAVRKPATSAGFRAIFNSSFVVPLLYPINQKPRNLFTCKGFHFVPVGLDAPLFVFAPLFDRCKTVC